LLTEIKLVDGNVEMLIRPRAGIAHTTLDVSFPAIREVVTNRTDDDGTRDTTTRHGAAAVSLALKLYQGGTTRAIIDELKGFCRPGSRPYLVVTDDEWGQVRRIMLRADQVSAPIEAGNGATRNLQASWKAPDGLWEDTEQTTLTVVADVPSSVGFSFPLTFPLALTPTSSGGSLHTTNVGNSPSHIVARLYGPCTAPRLINDTTGEAITFTTDLVLGPGDYIEISTRDRTAYLLSDTSASRLSMIDFSANTWWQLQPGLQYLRYVGTDSSPGSQAVIYYRPVWL
jgi:hypothetical protein